MFARIDVGIVVELLNFTSLEGRFTKALISTCVPCDETVTAGMYWDGESFSASPPRTAQDIRNELVTLDMAAVRPMHTVAAGKGVQDDFDKLSDLEDRKQALRAELITLGEDQ